MAGSVRGASHVASGMPRQDHWWVGGFGDDRVIALVACDGAGGVAHGGAGAALAVRALRDLVRREMSGGARVPSPETLGTLLEGARDVLGGASRSVRLPAVSLATTAMIAVSDGSATTAAHVGDGFIALQPLGEEVWLSMSAPQRGEYAGTTSFLTDESIYPVTSEFTDPVARLCLSTDGLEAVAWDDAGCGPHAPFLSGVASAVAAPAGFDAAASARFRNWLASPGLAARTHDDLTMCLASRVPS